MASRMVQFQDLPDDVLLEIFSHLSLPDLLQCTSVCVKWKELLRNFGPWKDKTYTTQNLGDMDEIVKLVKVIPQMKEICIVSSTSFSASVTSNNVRLTTRVNWGTFKCLILDTKIDRVAIPKYLFTRDLPQLFKNGRKLHSLTVSPDVFSPSASYKILRRLVRQETLSDLKVLKLYDIGKLKNDTVLELCQKCTKLEELSLHSSVGLSDEGLQNLNTCTNLRTLKLTRNFGIVNLSFLRLCPNLERLDLSLCSVLDRTSFHNLLFLKKLRIFTCRYSLVEGLPVKSMAEKLKQLKLIDLSCSCGVNSGEVRQVSVTAPCVRVLGGNGSHVLCSVYSQLLTTIF